MLFTSISFLYYFLPIVLIAYFIVPKKAKNFVLFIASMAFYFYGEPKYIFLMLAEIFIAYIGAILIAKYKKKSILTVTLAIHIGLLVFFKNKDFLIANINIFFNGFWTFFIIIPCIIDLFNKKRIKFDIIGIIVGFFLLLICLNIINLSLIIKLLIPLTLILLGLFIIYREIIKK